MPPANLVARYFVDKQSNRQCYKYKNNIKNEWMNEYGQKSLTKSTSIIVSLFFRIFFLIFSFPFAILKLFSSSFGINYCYSGWWLLMLMWRVPFDVESLPFYCLRFFMLNNVCEMIHWDFYHSWQINTCHFTLCVHLCWHVPNVFFSSSFSLISLFLIIIPIRQGKFICECKVVSFFYLI